MALDAADIAGVLAMAAVLCLCDAFCAGRIPRGNEMLSGTLTSRWVMSVVYQLSLMVPLGIHAVSVMPARSFLDSPAALHPVSSRAFVYLMFAMEARDVPHLKWVDNKVLIVHHVVVMISCVTALAFIEEGFGVFVMGVIIFEVGSFTFNLYVLRPKIREVVVAYVLVMTVSNIVAAVLTIYGATFSMPTVTRVFFFLAGTIMACARQHHVWREPIRKNWTEGASLLDSGKSKKAA
jgi:hypothetical protein